MVEKSKSYPRIINFLLQFSFDSRSASNQRFPAASATALRRTLTPPRRPLERKDVPEAFLGESICLVRYTRSRSRPITSALMTISLRPIFFSNAFPDPRNIRRSNHRGANITSFRSLPSRLLSRPPVARPLTLPRLFHFLHNAPRPPPPLSLYRFNYHRIIYIYIYIFFFSRSKITHSSIRFYFFEPN